MSGGLVAAVSQFVNAVIGIFVSLVNSVLAVFHAIFALGVNIVQSTFAVVKHLVAMVAEVFSGVLGFITGAPRCVLERTCDANEECAVANFVAIALIAGGYYAYTVYEKRNRSVVKQG